MGEPAMRSNTIVGLGFLMLSATWAPAFAIGGLFAGDPDRSKFTAGMVEKSTERAVNAETAQNAARRVNKAEQELNKRELALEREENYTNRTNETVHYLQ